MSETSPVVSDKQSVLLQISVLIVALCGIVYELLIATVSSYLLGDSVRQFSLTIGLFMAAMGLGAWFTKRMTSNLISRFILIEICVALVGGVSSILLFFVFPYTIFYQPVMYGLIIIIGALVGMEIPLLTRILTQRTSLKDSIANVLSLDYFGALVGSVAFPLFLLPFFGLFQASFFIGILNCTIALITIGVFSRNLDNILNYWLGAGTTCILLVVFFFLSHNITAFAEGQLYTDRIIFNKQTKYQKIIVTRDQFNGSHRLFIDGHIQFSETDEYRYHEALVHPILSSLDSKKNILILGGGDGMAAREVLKYPEVEHIDLVDLDSEMTTFCSTFAPIAELNNGALTNRRVRIHNVDGWQFLRSSVNSYCAIIVDLPDPHNESLNKLYSVEFYNLLRGRLKENGLMVTQSTSPLVTTNTFWSIGETMEAAGFHTLRYQVSLPSFSGNWGFTIGRSEGFPPSEFIIDNEKTRFLTSEVMSGATIFGKDERPSDPIVNSIFQPKLYLTYNSDVARW